MWNLVLPNPWTSSLKKILTPRAIGEISLNMRYKSYSFALTFCYVHLPRSQVGPFCKLPRSVQMPFFLSPIQWNSWFMVGGISYTQFSRASDASCHFAHIPESQKCYNKVYVVLKHIISLPIHVLHWYFD